MTLESRISRIENASQGGRRVCPECGRWPNGAFPPNTPEEVRHRELKYDDGTPKLKCTTCGATLMFLFTTFEGMKTPRFDSSKCQGPDGSFVFNFALAEQDNVDEP